MARIDTLTDGRIWTIAGIVFGFLVIDYCVASVFDSHSRSAAFISLGVCIAQLNLIGAWSALAPGNLMVRVPWSLLMTVLMWNALMAGNHSPHGVYDRSDAILLGLVLLFGGTVTQIPLWIAGQVWGWRLVGWNSTPSAEKDSSVQFNLRHMMIGTFLFSLSLGMTRFILPTGRSWWPDFDGDLLVLLCVSAFCNLVITVPCIWGAFARRSILLGLGVGWIVYCAILSIVEIAILMSLFGNGSGDALILVFLLNLSQCVTVWGTLLVFRAMRFRLLRVGAKAQHASPTPCS